MRILAIFLLSVAPGLATNWYVDSSVASSGNGLSWATAWQNVTNVTGVSAGDTIYISGGSTSQTYPLAAYWAPAGGASGNPITYQVGQDSGHNGTVIFDLGTLGGWILTPGNWVVIDGGVDGASHMTMVNGVQSSDWMTAQKSHGVVLRYITFEPGDAINLSYSDHYEIAFCTLHPTHDHGIKVAAPPTPTGYGENLIHDNVLTMDQTSGGAGLGVDGIQWAVGADIYNNIFQANPTNYQGGQHQDGVQTEGSPLYDRIYKNTFINLANSGVFLDCFSNCNNAQIYDNVIYMSNTQHAGGYQQGVEIIRDGGAHKTLYFTNIMVANNTIANYGFIAVHMGTSDPESVWDSSSMFYNNLGYAVGGFPVDSHITGVGSGTNLSVKSGGQSIFAAYQTPSSTGFAYDFHILPGSSTLREPGDNLSTYFSTDYDGKGRPTTGPWQVGAYVNGQTPEPPTSLKAAAK
jgi:hypothetical protein